MRETQDQTLAAGKRLPLFKAGVAHPSTFSASDMNLYVKAINALLNLKIRRGDGPSFEVTDEAAIIHLPMSPLSGTNP